MGRLIDADEVKKRYPIMENDFGMVINERLHKELDKIPTVEAISKADYENRLKADIVAMLTEIQLEIKELWDNRYDVWLDTQYYIGKSDTLGEVDEVIQQKINSLKENT